MTGIDFNDWLRDQMRNPKFRQAVSNNARRHERELRSIRKRLDGLLTKAELTRSSRRRARRYGLKRK